MFQTDESWEYPCRGQLLGGLFNQPGLRQYPCVEIPLNVQIFHVDIIFRDTYQDGQSWSRFIFDQMVDVVQIVERDDVIQARVSLQTSRCDDAEYSIRSIIEIVERKNVDGCKTYVFKCANNENYLDSFIEESESDLLEKRTIWPRRS